MRGPRAGIPVTAQEVRMALTPNPARGPDASPDGDEPSIVALLKRLGTESGELVRAELALAKLEFRELARQAAVDGAKVGAAAALALVGVIVLAAAGVLALADALGGHYALAALLVGVVLLAIGALLARSGIRSMSAAREPGGPLTSLRQDQQWAAGELSDLKKQLKGGARAEPAALKKP